MPTLSCWWNKPLILCILWAYWQLTLGIFIVEWRAETAFSKIEFKMLTQRRKSESFQCQLTLVIFWKKLGAASKASKPISSILSSPSVWYLVQVTLKTSKLDWQLPWALPFWLCQPSLATLNHNWPAGGTNNAASADLWLSFRITIDNGTARLRHIRIVCPRVLMSFQDFTSFYETT